MKKQRLAILGSTGSIGVQTLDVCRNFPDKFTVEALTAGSNADLLIKQAVEFNPNVVVIGDESKYEVVSNALEKTDIKVFCGYNSIISIAESSEVDTVVLSLVGIAGLKPAYAALKAGKKLAIANKEVLVVAGELITKTAIKNNSILIPIDSEHSAIMQCISGESLSSVKKILLTASGGPFRGYTHQQLKDVTVKQALAHPVWSMGSKISIDSSTMMNKGFEVIEAKWLFNVPVENIEVVIHPQSIIHSMVQFQDGSIKAQLSKPDMRLPILYSLTYPNRLPATFQNGGIENIHQLTFEKPDLETFKHLSLAYEAMKMGGGAPCVLNASNEVAVDLFLNGKISFTQMQEISETALYKIKITNPVSIDEYLMLDKETKSFCKTLKLN